MRGRIRGSLLAALAFFGAAGARAEAPERSERAALEHLRSGAFAKRLDAGLFAVALRSWPALKDSDPAGFAAIAAALDRAAPGGSAGWLDYAAALAGDACLARQLDRSFAAKDIAALYRQTAAAREALAPACEELERAENARARARLDLALSSAPKYADAYLHRALARARLGEAEGASADYRESLKAPPGTAPLPPHACLCSPVLTPEAEALAEARARGQAAKDRGVQLFLQGNATGALDAFAEAARHDPGDPEIYASRAVIHQSSGTLAEAVADYRTAFRLAADGALWDIAADAGLACAALRERYAPARAAALEQLESLVNMTGPEWFRRKAVSKELRALQRERR